VMVGIMSKATSTTIIVIMITLRNSDFAS